MSLLLPDDVPIAVEYPAVLATLGTISQIPGVRLKSGFAFLEFNGEFRCVWCRANYRDYRRCWEKAASAGLVDPLSAWGETVDADHVLAKCIVRMHNLTNWYLRLHPVFSEVNRSAGGGRERDAAALTTEIVRNGSIVFADELQILKMICHPVGTSREPISIFEK